MSVLVPHVKANKLRALAICGPKRSSALPDVPTSEESGLPDYEVNGWFGLLAPAGTPAPIIDRLNREIKIILASEDIRKVFQAEGSEADYLGPAEFGPFFSGEIAKWARVVKEAKIKIGIGARGAEFP